MDRELDLNIAKEIFGWNVYEDIPPDARGENAGQVLVPYKGYLQQLYSAGYMLPNIGKLGEGFFTPTYTRDYHTAMEVVKKVKLPTPAYQLPSSPNELAKIAYEYFKTNNTIQ